ncbi:MAG TPA: phosphoribosylanthranilate isomerase [Arenibacter sp.]|nr:phosphoribosylanthranilate isomerase [Arenibacter sp.]
MKIKVCGMKYPENISEVTHLLPDYLGFIFWEPSARFFDGSMGDIPDSIKKVGVFVDADLEKIVKTINRYDLQAVQLHGKESPEFCQELRKVTWTEPDGPKKQLEIIKVFSIKDDFDFRTLAPYETVCDYYLFDTKGKLPGGNGYTFSWEVLRDYPSSKPYFLSGGIGLEETAKIKDFLKKPESKYCYAIDLNSKFEHKPGLKDVGQLMKFKKRVLRSGI